MQLEITLLFGGYPKNFNEVYDVNKLFNALEIY
jgi:hypothetical protein